MLFLQPVYFHLRFPCVSDLRNAHFLLVRSNGETYRTENFWSQKNDVIIHIFYQIKVVNRALPSFNEGFLKITLTVTLSCNPLAEGL